MCNSKIISLLFLVIIKHVCATLPLSNTTTTHLKFKSLQACLTLSGVNEKNIIPRSNGKRYTDLNWQWNTLHGYVTPLAYLVANDVLEIQRAVLCCQLCKVRVVARSGGHSYIKSGFGDSNTLVIDLKRLNKISPDPMQMNCEIGPGAEVFDISDTLLKKGNFVVPVGICATVGVGGLAQGGGYGYFSRPFGISSDNLIGVEMVTAKGELVTANNYTNTDLFWALRGGGGGSFGIVTKLKFKMNSGPKSVVFGIYNYKFDLFPLVYSAWQSLLTSNTPNYIGTQIEMSKDVIRMEVFCFNFENVGIPTLSAMDIENLISSFSFPNPINSSIELQSHNTFLLSTADYYNTTDFAVGWKKVKSMYVYKVLNETDISQLQTLLTAYLEWSKIYLTQDGGAIDNFCRSETAFVHRYNLYNIQLQAFNADSDEENVPANSAMNAFYENSKLVLNHRESYQNFLDENIPDYLERYYVENLQKLIEIKTRIDPDNVFHHPQSIPTVKKR